MPHQSHPPWPDQLNNIWWSVQVMKFTFERDRVNLYLSASIAVQTDVNIISSYFIKFNWHVSKLVMSQSLSWRRSHGIPASLRPSGARACLSTVITARSRRGATVQYAKLHCSFAVTSSSSSSGNGRNTWVLCHFAYVSNSSYILFYITSSGSMRQMKWQEAGEDCKMRSFVTCTLHQML